MTIVLGTSFIRYGLIAGGLLVADGTRAADATLPPVAADVRGSPHEANRKEIQAGEIAQNDGRSKAAGANDRGTMAAGRDFDRAFAREMLDDHRKAIAAVTEALNTTVDPQLRKLLTALLPTLQKREAAAEKIIDAEANK